jgi:hypothetical protein
LEESCPGVYDRDGVLRNCRLQDQSSEDVLDNISRENKDLRDLVRRAAELLLAPDYPVSPEQYEQVKQWLRDAGMEEK